MWLASSLLSGRASRSGSLQGRLYTFKMPSASRKRTHSSSGGGKKGRGRKGARPHGQRMAGVRQKGTAAELVVRQMLDERRVAFEANPSDLPGRPDLVDRKGRLAIFVHGCFWHRHANCPSATTPKSNTAFWLAKFEANVIRDRAKVRLLRMRGYRVLTVWECEIKRAGNRDKLQRKLDKFLNSPHVQRD